MTNEKQLQVQSFGGFIDKMKPKFEELSEKTQLSFGEEKLHALSLLSKNDFLMKIAQSNKASLAGALLSLTTIDLTLNPAMKLAYLVPRDGGICLDISYMGMIELAYRSGIKKINCQLVYKNDEFHYDGAEDKITHSFNPFEERGEFAGGYVRVLLPSGQWSSSVMSAKEIFKIRERSMAFKRGNHSPWKTDESEMIKKTIIKRAFKTWPKSEKLANAIDYVNQYEGIDFEKEKEEMEKKRVDDIKKIQDENDELAQLKDRVVLEVEKKCDSLGAVEKVEFLESIGIDSIHEIYRIKFKEELENIAEKAIS